MSKTKASLPPSPSPAATGAADSANLGMLRNAIPVTKQQALIRTRIAGDAYEFDHGFVWQPDDAGPQAYRWDQVATVKWFASQHYVNGAYTGSQYWLTLATTDGRSLKFSGSCKDPAAKGGRNADPLASGYLLYQFLIRARDDTPVISRDGGIRTRGLLLPNQANPVVRQGCMSPGMELTCIDPGPASADVAWRLWLLAPILAPAAMLLRHPVSSWQQTARRSPPSLRFRWCRNAGVGCLSSRAPPADRRRSCCGCSSAPPGARSSCCSAA